MKKRTAKEMINLVAELQAIYPEVKDLESDIKSEWETSRNTNDNWHETSNKLAAIIAKLTD